MAVSCLLRNLLVVRKGCIKSQMLTLEARCEGPSKSRNLGISIKKWFKFYSKPFCLRKFIKNAIPMSPVAYILAKIYQGANGNCWMYGATNASFTHI